MSKLQGIEQNHYNKKPITRMGFLSIRYNLRLD